MTDLVDRVQDKLKLVWRESNVSLWTVRAFDYRLWYREQRQIFRCDALLPFALQLPLAGLPYFHPSPFFYLPTSASFPPSLSLALAHLPFDVFLLYITELLNKVWITFLHDEEFFLFNSCFETCGMLEISFRRGERIRKKKKRIKKKKKTTTMPPSNFISL